MKKIFILFGALALLTVGACQKEEVQESISQPTTKTNSSKSGIATMAQTVKGLNRKYYSNLKDCASGSPKNCFDDVIIKPKVHDDLMACVANGPTAVGSYFNGTAWHDYLPDLLDQSNATLLTDLQSGQFYFEADSNPDTNHEFILVYQVGAPSGSNPKYVFDFIVQ